MNKLSPILLSILIGLSVTSCAEWLGSEDFPDSPDAVTLSHHELTMLVGDTCRLNAVFTPEDFIEKSVLWTATPDTILSVDGNTVVAEKVGYADVVVSTAIGARTDTCRVQVQPAWGDVQHEMYDMVVYARLDPSLDPEDVEIGAFWGEILAGKGVHLEAHGIKYTMLRIYSKTLSSKDMEVPITFRCHLRRQGCVVQFPDTIYFDGEMHGTLSNLYPLNLD